MLFTPSRKRTQIVKFNSPLPYTLSLQCPSYNKFSQLLYEPGCSRELWCRKCATWLWNKYVLFFLKVYFIYISKDILLLRAQSSIKQCKWYFPKSRNVKDYENVKLVNLSSGMAAQLHLILCMFSINNYFGVGGKCKVFYGSKLCTHEHKIHHSEKENYFLAICI